MKIKIQLKKLSIVCGEATRIKHVKSGLQLCAGDFSTYDVLQLGRPVEIDSDENKTLLANNKMQKIVNIHRILELHTEKQFSPAQLFYLLWYCVCDLLFICNKNVPFLKEIVTGNKN